MVHVYWMIYSVFGSGSRHMAYAVFQEFAKKYNNGKTIGLVRCAGTRFAGWFYAFHRLIKLWTPLKETINSDTWIDDVKFKKKGQKEQIQQIIKCDAYVNTLKLIVLMMLPAIKCLRLADRNLPGMDQIHFYTRQTTARIQKMALTLDEFLDIRVFNQWASVDEDYIDDHVKDKEMLEHVTSSYPTRGSAMDIDSDDESTSDEETKANKKDKPFDPIKCISNACTYVDKQLLKGDSFGALIYQCWRKRALQLSSDYAIAGWLLSVDPDIWEDAKKYRQEHAAALKRVAEKLYSHICPIYLKLKYVQQTMHQFTLFRNRLFPYDNEQLWNSPLCSAGDSHLWHANFSSVIPARELTYVACKVCSKVLGIGSCERAWGAAKAQKDGQRTCLSAKALEKTATLYGAHSMQCSLARAKKMEEWDILDSIDTDKDFELVGIKSPEFALKKEVFLDLSNDQDNIDLWSYNLQTRHEFHAYLEEWEKEYVHKNDAMAQYKLLAKYQNMRYMWPDSNHIAPVHTCYISEQRLIWLPKKKDDAWGWCVILVPKGRDYDDERIQEYEHKPIKGKNSFHHLIAICDQREDVVVVDEEGVEVSPEDLFVRQHHVAYPGRWDTFPDNTEDNLFYGDKDN